jgi:hypothetical protein
MRNENSIAADGTATKTGVIEYLVADAAMKHNMDLRGIIHYVISHTALSDDDIFFIEHLYNELVHGEYR